MCQATKMNAKKRKRIAGENDKYMDRDDFQVYRRI